MTASDLTPAQAERLDVGPVLVKVPMICDCPCHDYESAECDECDDCEVAGLVPDPAWSAAAKPTCETCGGLAVALNADGHPSWHDPRCPACDGSGEPPRVEVTVSCSTCDGLGRLDLPRGDVCPCPHCDRIGTKRTGRVSVPVQVEGPLLEVVRSGECAGPPAKGHPKHICIGPFLDDEGNESDPGVMALHVTHMHDIAADVSDQLQWLAPDGDVAGLVGKWVAWVVAA